ncbi:hypothetical protein BAXH7_00627 [Bacillus amyloliquefaciens XH7]|nr:hypothetical protein LL3_00683 [Bacillus amyloliquefaciens LL3]AEK87772.1 hypothetical protein BAXH7_00627 [Bacillus amyloliquefaciens XH7]KYC94138.1 hypothetical protein B425_0671 [Bacillus amyloliquefaciens]QBG55046.1 hypothetical protein D2M30_0695 [Bacillus amyloliquefaciens]
MLCFSEKKARLVLHYEEAIQTGHGAYRQSFASAISMSAVYHFPA